MFAGGGRGGLVVALRNCEWGFREGGEYRGRGGEISIVIGPWRGGGFVVDLVGGAGGSVVVVATPPPFFLFAEGSYAG